MFNFDASIHINLTFCRSTSLKEVLIMFIRQATTIGVPNLKYSRSEKSLSLNPIQDGGRGGGDKKPPLPVSPL